jgi:hypothetical protein
MRQRHTEQAARIADLEHQASVAREAVDRARTQGEESGRRAAEERASELAQRLHIAEQQAVEASTRATIMERETEIATGQARAVTQERATLLERLREAERSTHAATWEFSAARHAADAKFVIVLTYLHVCVFMKI